MQPEDIAALRQRAGKLRTIADESSLADASNLKASGNAQMGKSPLGSGGKIGLLDRGLQAIQGGPEIIGNRALNKALTGITPKNTPFPDINPPGPSMSLRPPPVRGISSEVPTFDATPNTEQADQLMSNIGSRNALRDAQASANKMAAQNEFLHSNNLEQQAQGRSCSVRRQRMSGFEDSKRRSSHFSACKLEGPWLLLEPSDATKHLSNRRQINAHISQQPFLRPTSSEVAIPAKPAYFFNARCQ